MAKAKSVFHQTDILEMSKRYRTKFVNSLTGFKSVSLVGSINKSGNENLAIFSQIFHLGANPALIGMIVRPASTTRNTLDNIQETKHFTLNHIQESFYERAHQTSARYKPEVSEFKKVGLTPEYSSLIKAPYVQESEVKLGLELAYEHFIPLNETILLVGKIIEVIVPSDSLKKDGYIDIQQAGTITIAGLDAYHKASKLLRLEYAKPDEESAQLDKSLF